MALGAHHPLRQLHLAVVVPALVRLVRAGAGVLLVLQYLHQVHRLVLEAHPLNFAAAVAAAAVDVAVAASAAASFAGSLQLLVTWSWSSLAAGLAHPVVLLAAAEDPLRLHPQAGVGKRGGSLAVPGQAA